MIDLSNLEKQKADLDIKIQEEENNLKAQKQEFTKTLNEMLKKDLFKLLPYLVISDLLFLVLDPVLLIVLLSVEVLGVNLGMKVARENFVFPGASEDALLENLQKERNKIDELIRANKERPKMLYNEERLNPLARKNEYNNQKLVLKRKGK